MVSPMSLLAPDLLSTAEEDIFCLCPCSPRLTGMGGPFQAWIPLLDLSVDGGSMDKLSQKHRQNE